MFIGILNKYCWYLFFFMVCFIGVLESFFNVKIYFLILIGVVY